MDDQRGLSRRERQIMTIVYSLGEASAADVWQRLPDQPSNTTVRTLLRILEGKGHLHHFKRGRQFVYTPPTERINAGQSALKAVLQTFFDGSLEKAVAAHLLDPDGTPSGDELRRMASLIREARRQEDE